MGQCCSAPVDSPRQAPPAVPQAALTDRLLHPVVQCVPGGLQVAVSQAQLSAGETIPLLFRQTAHGVLVALFEGLGTDRHAVAAYCRSCVLELFQESMVRHPESPLEALKSTLERLDAAIFATERLKSTTKASSGASAVLLLLEMGSQRCYCANVGAAHCLLSRISGSFNAKTPEGFFLTAEHTTRNRDEVVRLQRRTPGDATPPRPGSGGGEWEPAAAVEHTRALGFWQAKQQAGGSGALICEAYATEHTLTGTDQHLVLGSSAFWQLVGPADCALRAHFHEKFASHELERAAAVSAASAAAGLQEAPSPALLQAANTAEHLVYWSLEKAARKMAKKQQSGHSSRAGGVSGSSGAMPPSVGDLLALPLSRPPLQTAPLPDDTPRASHPAVEEEGTVCQGVQQLHQLIRSDVVGDVGVIVVTLRRQDQSMDEGMRAMMRAAHACAAVAKAKQGGGQGGGEEGYVERLARRRWAQIRMLLDFYKAHRRVVLRQWWAAQDALYRRTAVCHTSGRISLLGLSPGKAQAMQLAAGAAAVVAAKRSMGNTPREGEEDQSGASNGSLAGALVAAGGAAAKKAGGAPSVSRSIKAVRPTARR